MTGFRRCCWAVSSLGLLLLSSAVASAFFRPPPVRPPRPPVRPPLGSSIQPGFRPSTAISRTPRQVQSEIRAMLPKQPATALQQLSGQGIGRVLSAQARNTLARQAIEQLTLHVEQNTNPTKSWKEVRLASRHASTLEARLQQRLTKLQERAEIRAVAEGVQQISSLLEQGKWNEATFRSEVWILDLQSHATLPQKTQLLQTLRQAQKLSQTLTTLESFQQTVQQIQLPLSRETHVALQRLQPAQLPASLRPSAEALRGLTELQQIVLHKQFALTEVPRLQNALRGIERGLTELPQFQPSLISRTQQELAVRAALNGHAESYFRLMPENPSPEFAAQLLRDMKVATLGEGKLQTEAVHSSLLTGNGPGASGPPRAPPGLEPLIPEGPRSRWRPPLREPALTDLPPLRQTLDAAAKLKEHAQARGSAEQKKEISETKKVTQQLHGIRQQLLLRESQEKERLAELERILARPLSFQERLRARAGFDDNRSREQILNELRQLQREDDNAFLQELEKQLGKMLSPQQREEVLRWRRQGVTLAEIVKRLKS